LPKTQALVLRALAPLGLEVTSGKRLDSVTAVLRGARPGPAVLLRGDMDGLPVTEATGEPFTSRHVGVMHACGHDLHVAGLVGAARLLASRRAEVPGDVVFMFQPGEEGDGGAQIMIDEGVLEAAGERVVAGYGLHARSAITACGMIASRPGPLLAAVDRFRVTVHGRGGHGSAPWLAADPVPVAAEIVLGIQSMVARTFDAFDPVVISVGMIQAGTANNIIGDDTLLDSTIRTLSPANRLAAEERVRRLVAGITAAHGMTATFEWLPSYPVTVNHAPEVTRLAGLVTAMYGEDRYAEEEQPVLGGEDFSYVLEQVPGAFFWLGATPPELDPATAPYNHAATARYCDQALAVGPAVLAALALDRLAEG
ncbi:MAG: M20 family metallopeptidase, partial [Micrococcales bacterium]|nr:M20 family metallopeptidase [Micrococcales bacterium]